MLLLYQISPMSYVYVLFSFLIMISLLKFSFMGSMHNNLLSVLYKGLKK
nr:ATP synthase F0 subunit 8 [Pseudocapillaria tomentosa]